MGPEKHSCTKPSTEHAGQEKTLDFLYRQGRKDLALIDYDISDYSKINSYNDKPRKNICTSHHKGLPTKSPNYRNKDHRPDRKMKNVNSSPKRKLMAFQ